MKDYFDALLRKASTLQDVEAGVANSLKELAAQHGRLGYASGAITADGPDGIPAICANGHI